jgi:polyhydroxyalkanoate synthesis regulator protein
MLTKSRLALAVLALACFLGGSAPVRAEAPEKLLPADCEMVMSFNIKNMMASQAFNKHFKEMLEKQINSNEQFKKVLSAINMDPMKDLHSITMAFSDLKIEPGNPRPDMQIFVVVKGKFDTQKIETAITLFSADGKDKVAVSQVGNRKVFEFKGDDRTMFGAFLDNDTAVFADKKDRLVSSLEKRSEGKGMNKDFAKVLDRVDTKRSMWMAMVVPASVKDLVKILPRGEVFEKVEGAVFSVNVTDGLAVEMNVYTTDKDAAQQIKDMFQEGKENLGPLTLQIPDADLGAEVADIISKMKISQNDKTTSMSLDVGAGTLDKIVKFAKSRAGSGQ